MIKTTLRFLVLRLFPGWLIALLAVLATYALLTPFHSFILVKTWPLILSVPEDSPSYSVVSTEEETSSVVPSVHWDTTAVSYVLPYTASVAAEDFMPHWVASLPFLQHHSEIEFRPGSPFGLWYPVNTGYKSLVYRQDGNTYLDVTVLQNEQDAQVYLDSITTGFRKINVDPFGGLFLMDSLVSQPQQVSDVEEGLQVADDSPASQQLVKEVWALDHQLNAVSNVLTLLVAGLLVCLPWITRAWYSRTAVFLLGYSVCNVGLYTILLYQYQWVYPLILPLVSLFTAWFWHRRILQLNGRYSTLQDSYFKATKKWIDRLLDDGKPDASLRYLVENKLDQALYAPLWLDVSRGFERNRQYDKAIECLNEVTRMVPSHSEAKSKIKSLSGVIDGAKTQVLANGAGELPVGQLDNLKLGRYQLIKELGRGAMGIVYEAQDPKINRHIAVKVVHLKSLGFDEVDQVKQRFFREAQAAGKLNHPNIVTVYDVGEEHDVAYIAMDLLVGDALSDLIGKKPIDVPKMVKWIAQAAEALAYAHEHDIVHRDVKPANMIIEARSGAMKLTDFGVARIAGVQQTQTGIVLGSPSYMSPEQIRGETLTGATDVFSLGVSLFQCVTGALPFAGDTLPALAYAITQTKQDSARNVNPNVPVSLVRIINKSLQKEPADRYQSATDFANSLNKWVLDNQS